MRGKVIKRAKKHNFKTPEGRREYQRRYYEEHKDHAQEYQRLYNLKHKKSTNRKGCRPPKLVRETVKQYFTPSDIMHMPAERAAVVVQQILNGERWFTM